MHVMSTTLLAQDQVINATNSEDPKAKGLVFTQVDSRQHALRKHNASISHKHSSP